MGNKLDFKIKIEKGVPIPPARMGLGKWMAIVEQCEEGDSFVVPSKKHAMSFQGSLRRTRGYGLRIVSRVQDDGTVRVWVLKGTDPEARLPREGKPTGKRGSRRFYAGSEVPQQVEKKDG